MNKYIKHIPTDVEEFQKYINETDDAQKAIDTVGYTIYARDAKGKIDFQDTVNNKEIKNRPMYERMDWTEDESKEWSRFREEYNIAYAKYKDTKDGKGKEELEKIINECIAYDKKQGVIQRISDGGNTPYREREIFKIQQDILEYKTPFRTIKLKYEAQQALQPYEEKYIKKYIEHHNHTYEVLERLKRFRTNVAALHKTIAPLWEQIYILKDKADKATNTIFLPPPHMMGSHSPVVRFYNPTQEELQQYCDDFNNHFQQFYKELSVMCKGCDVLHDEEEWVIDIYNFEDKPTKKFFDEMQKLRSALYGGRKGTLEIMTVDKDYDGGFLTDFQAVKETTEAADNDWSALVGEQKIFLEVYNTLTTFLKEKFNPTEPERAPFDVSAPPPPEADELKEETMTRYRADLANGTETYFDSQDWHVIMDHYMQKHDHKNIAIAMKRARTLHPDEPTLIIRDASIKMDEHKYQEAMELMKLAEVTGPPYHPNYYTTRANIYMQLKTPELAIPLFRKLISQEAKELKWWRDYSYDQLIEIYDEKKEYEECILLSLETYKDRQDDEWLVAKLSDYYCKINKQDKAIKLLNDFLETHPKSSTCIERLAHIYFEKKEYDKTIEYADKSYSLDKGENYGALAEKGNALIELKKYQEALVCFELAHFYFKLTKEYHLGAAECYVNLNIPQQAIYHYRKALTLDADNKEALEALKLLGSKAEVPLN
jgi:tetratricopeptide (TPR) repeat protein